MRKPWIALKALLQELFSMNSPEPKPLQALNPDSKYKSLGTLSRTVIATALLVAAVSGAALFMSGSGFFAAPQGDSVSSAEQQARIAALNALGALSLAIVPAADVPAALQSMHLDPSATAALVTELAPHLPVAPGNTPSANVQQVPGGAVPDSSALLSPATEPSIRFAWVTLWDSDVEDGDAVRIQSGGYLRTVMLTKQGITFAIPVPADGKIALTGVQDGDGGGITVGLGSGGVKAVLPIMSVGQILTLNVKAN
ncbi:hypothetical protein NYP20_09135 [Pseudomonas sp. N3-W]|uniref:hypothetical protein n=1 Tax=Pseudomonas sp. N3-W TaxID=2975049 RepID=UPI00217E7DEE|nr:hypothetical protein [Pseudomonas sp. N3-W]UWF51106.1 hypothetical protein NYP20_09135 [Pseudomonas sp. N3-W]